MEDKFILLMIAPDGFIMMTEAKKPIELVEEAIRLYVSKEILGWQLQHLVIDWISVMQGQSVGNCVPLAQSPNWEELREI